MLPVSVVLYPLTRWAHVLNDCIPLEVAAFSIKIEKN